MSTKRLRLGHVEGEDAKRLREILNVEGISLEDLTRRTVKSYLSQKSSQDEARHTVKVVSDSTIPFRHVDGLGMCLICEGVPVTLEKFVGMIRDAIREAE